MVNYLFIFIVALLLVAKGATLAVRYAVRLAESFCLSKYTIGFIVIAFISVLPETLISLNAAIKGVSSFGLGMLFGSNIADLTLLFAAIVFMVGRNIKVETKIIKNHSFYPFVLILPLILGLNGHYSRLEGMALALSGGIFCYLVFRKGPKELSITENKSNSRKLLNSAMLLLGLAIMLIGSYFVVLSATKLADHLGINPILIGMLVVGLGTTLPEFFFSLKSVKRNDDSLAVGDILGTVLADSTIVVGILALAKPFFFPVRIIYITGLFMVVASFVLFKFMKSGKILSRKEATMLFLFWVIFVLVEFLTNT